MSENPYSPPLVACEPPDDFIDRPLRERLAMGIRALLKGDDSEFLDDNLVEKLNRSRDQTVLFIGMQLNLLYDDLITAPRPKSAWDHTQRLLLLLESNRTVTWERSFHWSGSQLVAFTALVLYVALACWLQIWGWHLLLLSIPFSVVTYAIFATHKPPQQGPYDSILCPFKNFAELKAIYESTPHFKKQPFQIDGTDKPQISPLMNAFFTLLSIPVVILFIAIFCTLSPIVLFYQCFPSYEPKAHILDPQTR